MLVAACVLPHPPLLIDEVSVTAPAWLVDLRDVVAGSMQALLARDLDLVVAVGRGSGPGEWDESAGGTLAAHGVDARAGGPDLSLPVPLTVAARLLDDAGWGGPRRYVALSPMSGADGNAAVGRRSARSAERVGMVVMGDGSARRTTEAPGYLDERAGPFDAAVVAALAGVDVGGLLALDANTADELWVAGVPAWQALAGALEPGAAVSAHVAYDGAPRGVGYFVVDWTVDGSIV